jgi:hypothetical protein
LTPAQPDNQAYQLQNDNPTTFNTDNGGAAARTTSRRRWDKTT